MAVTPNYSWPVPVNTDYVKDGAEAIKDLGDAIDATVFGLPSGGLTLINTTTFSAAATVTIDNVFTATYKNYLMVYANNGTSVVFQFRNTTPATVSSGYYGGGWFTDSNGSNGTYLIQSNTASLNMGGGIGSWDMTIFSPFEETVTRTTALQAQITGTTSVTSSFRNSNQSASTSMGGIIITGTSMTGQISIYGLAN